jgi:hypothetical protein
VGHAVACPTSQLSSPPNLPLQPLIYACRGVFVRVIPWSGVISIVALSVRGSSGPIWAVRPFCYHRNAMDSSRFRRRTFQINYPRPSTFDTSLLSIQAPVECVTITRLSPKTSLLQEKITARIFLRGERVAELGSALITAVARRKARVSRYGDISAEEHNTRALNSVRKWQPMAPNAREFDSSGYALLNAESF